MSSLKEICPFFTAFDRLHYMKFSLDILSTQPLCLAYTQDSVGHPGHHDYVQTLDSYFVPKVKSKYVHVEGAQRVWGWHAPR